MSKKVDDFQKYYNTSDQYENNDWVTGQCAEISFLNLGDQAVPPSGADVTILGFILHPGFGISFDGNECELDTTKYQIIFSGAGIRNCLVVRKNYV